MICDPSAHAPIDWTHKGFHPADEGRDAAALAAQRRSLFDDGAFFPAATLKDSVIRANSAWMRAFTKRAGVLIAPHGKTTMAPDLMRLQIEDGAWGITAATVQHVRAYRRWGIKRVFMANELVGAGAIAWVVDALNEDPAFDFYCLADSIVGVEAMERIAAARGARRPIQVLVEVGLRGGRAGVRDVAEGLAIARAIAAAPHLRLAGVETFEGVFQMRENGAARADEALSGVINLAQACDKEGLFTADVLLSGGGTAFFDRVPDVLRRAPLSRPTQILLRSGCYLSHDDGMYRRFFDVQSRRSADVAAIGYGLKPALQVWGHVLSRPERGRMIVGVGRRDVGADSGMPTIEAWARPGDRAARAAPEGWSVTALNDQHAFLDGVGEAPFEVGDLVGFGVSHPCTTFDKWRALLRVDDDYVITGVARTYF